MLKIAYFDPLYRPAGFIDALRGMPDVELAIAPDEAAIPAAVSGAEILVTGNRYYTAGPAALIRDHGKALRWLAFNTSGIDKAVAAGLPPDVIVTNVAGLRAFAVAERAFALMLGLTQQIRVSETARLTQDWASDRVARGVVNVARRHAVIVGLGAIGQDFARKARAFGMRVTGVSRSTDPLPGFDAILPREQLVDAARSADVLMVAALAGPQTDGMISRAVIGAMRPGAFLVNIARGSLVDEPALIEALQARRIAGAGLDVASVEPLPKGHPFWNMDNVLLSPHVAGAGDPGEQTQATIFMANLQRWRAGARLANIVLEPGKARAT